MFPGKTHAIELLGKRVEIGFDSCGFNTSQDARLFEILVQQDASLASRLSDSSPEEYMIMLTCDRSPPHQGIDSVNRNRLPLCGTPHIPELRIPPHMRCSAYNPDQFSQAPKYQAIAVTYLKETPSTAVTKAYDHNR